MAKETLSFSLDRHSPVPLYQQVKEHITRQIEHGVLPPETRLPSTRDLAAQLGIARISIVNAYEELKEAGYLTAQVGRGTFVAPQPEPAASPTAGSSQHTSLRHLMQLADRPGVINFSTGTPPDGLLPVDLIRQTVNDVLESDGTAAIAYEDPEGYYPLRQTIAQMVAREGIQAHADDVLITGGCQQALDLAVQALLTPGDVVLTSNPTYAGFLDILQARGMTPVGVSVDAYGMRTDLLEAIIVENRPRLIYVAPTYHNPTGTVMPRHRREYLLAVAGRYHIPVLEDGVYQDLVYEGAPPPPLKALDTADLVLHASSYSKAMMPGMRIGYLIVGERLYGRIARVKRAADVCTPGLNQRVIHRILAEGLFERYLSNVKRACVSRRSAMLNAVDRHLPEATYTSAKGGLYLWVNLPDTGPTVTELFVHAVEAGVAFAPGPLFHADASGAYQLRLNMTTYPPATITKGIAALGAVWRRLADSHAEPTGDSVPFL